MHLFFTGKRNIGKSTLVKYLIRNYTKLGGFITYKATGWHPEHATVHFLDLSSSNSEIKETNLLFVCNKGIEQKGIDRFNRLGCEALNKSIENQVDIIVMDELGPHEEKAVLFQKQVVRVLNQNIPIIGVLQDSESAFLDKIKNHKRVKVVEVTEKNRKQLRNINLSLFFKRKI